jgi:hypothetical protein
MIPMKQNAVLIISFFILSTLVNAQHAPYHESPVIYGVKFDWPSHIRLASGSDNWPITWAGDDNQYVVWGDGGGFGGTNKYGRSSIGVARIEGKWHDFKATNIWGGYNSENDHDVIGKSYGIICINNVLTSENCLLKRLRYDLEFYQLVIEEKRLGNDAFVMQLREKLPRGQR